MASLLAALTPIVLASGSAAGRQQDDVMLLQAKTDVGSVAVAADPSDAPFRQTLVNFGDAQYGTSMRIGQQLITAMVDTGSSGLVVFETGCSAQRSSTQYSAQRSSTFVEGQLQTELQYSGGRVIPTSAQEEMSIGPFYAANQTFWYAKSASACAVEGTAFQAILGLGLPEEQAIFGWKVAQGIVQMLVDMYDEGRLAPRQMIVDAAAAINVAKSVTSGAPMLRTMNVSIFSICLGAKPGSDGVLMWNDKVHTELPELFTRVNIARNASWIVNLNDATMNWQHGSVKVDCDGACTALLDTGSSVIAVPGVVKQHVEEAMEALNANCSNLEVLPSIQFKLGEATVSLTPDVYVSKITGKHSEAVQAKLEGLPTASSCHLLLMDSKSLADENKPQWILGVPFFRKYYTTFDLAASSAERAVYIASNAGDCSFAQKRPELMMQRRLETRTLKAEHVRLPSGAFLSPAPTLREPPVA